MPGGILALAGGFAERAGGGELNCGFPHAKWDQRERVPSELRKWLNEMTGDPHSHPPLP